MTSELARRARNFCLKLGQDTGRQPMQWRSILLIGAMCRVRAPAELKKIVAYAEKKGWLVSEGSNNVCLTHVGRKLPERTP